MRKNKSYHSFFDIQSLTVSEKEKVLSDFSERYFSIVDSIGITKNLSSDFDNSDKILFDLMSHEMLHFHTPIHILSILDFYEELPSSKEKPILSNEEFLAILYHDSFYDPKSEHNENELYSSMIFENCYRDYIDNDMIGNVKELILETANHGQDKVNKKAHLLLDFDIHYFAADFDIFNVCNECVRKEYSHFSDVDWKNGRVSFLNSMLNKKSIYRTEYFKEYYEKKARSNIEKLIFKMC